ncbi:MAG: alpha/beta hydrolase-fold protein [Bdellovibrionota bacterium]
MNSLPLPSETPDKYTNPQFDHAHGQILAFPLCPKHIGHRERIGRFDCLYNVESHFLELSHNVYIALPTGYDNSGDYRYPVLYMPDGKNLFYELPNQGGSPVKWGIDHSLDQLHQSGEIEPPIIVAIGQNAHRNRELLHMDHPEVGEALGQQFMRMIVSEIKPFIDREFRTRTEPENTGIIGSSLGGNLSLFAVTEHRNTFGIAGSLSPSLYYRGADLLGRIDQGQLKRARLWTSYGSHERTRPVHVERFQAMLDKLQERGWVKGVNFCAGIVPGGDHSENTWGRLFPYTLKFLYAKSVLAY